MGIFVFLIIIFVVVAVAYLMTTCTDGFIAGIIFIPVVFLSTIAIPYISHNSDLAKIDNGESVIKIQEDYVERLSDRLNSLPKTDGALMNRDTPIATIVDAIAESEKKIADANSDILEAKMNIQKRERGLTSYVLWFF